MVSTPANRLRGARSPTAPAAPAARTGLVRQAVWPPTCRSSLARSWLSRVVVGLCDGMKRMYRAHRATRVVRYLFFLAFLGAAAQHVTRRHPHVAIRIAP